MPAANQNTPDIQKEVMLDTIVTANGSWEGTWGTRTSRMNRKKSTVRKRSTIAPFLEMRGWGDESSVMDTRMLAN